MRKEIRQRLENGESRADVFETMRGDVDNEERLAQKIATVRIQPATGRLIYVNYLLVFFVLAQTIFGICAAWVEFGSVHADLVVEVSFLVGIITVLYVIGIARMSFLGYACFLMFCFMTVADYIYIFEVTPVISILGLLMAVINFALAYFLKVRLFPHMGFSAIRKDNQGRFILE